jgi:hypothetical protein
MCNSKPGIAGLVVSTKREIAENCDLKQFLMHIYQTQSMEWLRPISGSFSSRASIMWIFYFLLPFFLFHIWASCGDWL